MLRILLALVAVVGVVLTVLWIGFYLSPQDQLETADAIVALSGGDTTARTLKAIELYQAGWAPLLIFSGAAHDPGSPSNAAAMRQIALNHGVPTDAIATEDKSENTEENARNVSAILSVLHYHRIILVTSPYHQRRASWEFAQHLSASTQIINQSASDPLWSRYAWWITPTGWYLTLSELAKTGFARISMHAALSSF